MSRYKAIATSQFKRDYKRVKKRKKNIDLLNKAILALANGEQLPDAMRDHGLAGDWQGFRECHIQPDWLLIYRIDDDILVLTLMRTGSHSDLFG